MCEHERYLLYLKVYSTKVSKGILGLRHCGETVHLL